MKARWSWILAVALLAACERQSTAPAEPPAAPAAALEPQYAERSTIGEVDPLLLNAPMATFAAIEPSEVGVFAAPTVMEALTELIGVGAHEGGENVQLTVRESGDVATADIVRMGIADDSVRGGHIRIEFRREPDGWFPTNAYRRLMCARGPNANHWQAELCV